MGENRNYEFEEEDKSINEVNDYYVKMANGKSRLVTEFFEVMPNISFKEFNNYINDLDELKEVIK